jgi:hypothetical protein
LLPIRSAGFALFASLATAGWLAHGQSALDGQSSAGERPIAIVPLDAKIPGAAQEVTGALKVSAGRAFITTSGEVTAGTQTTQVTLPYRGTLRVCASTSVKLAANASVPAGEVPGLMMAMDHGAIEASFATGRGSEVLLTPDFRILLGGPGTADVKVRLGAAGDTCVDNAAGSAAFVLVSSVFEGGSYRVQAGQRVMFQRGSLLAVVDREKEPCGCPPPVAPQSNEFPLAQSEGLAPTPAPAPKPETIPGKPAQTADPLIYKAADHAPLPAEPAPAPAPPPPTAKKSGFFAKVGHFFKRIFGSK